METFWPSWEKLDQKKKLTHHNIVGALWRGTTKTSIQVDAHH